MLIIGVDKPNPLMIFYAWFKAFMLSPLVLMAIFIGNGIGAVAGLLYWYDGHLARSPWYLWAFIPDSPLSTFWVLPALVLILWRKPGWPWFNAFAAFGVIKYGIWTVAFWSLYWANGGMVGLEGVAMSLTHAVMAVQGIFLLGYTRLTTWVALGLGAWFLLNDWIDFGPLQTHPGLPPGVSAVIMMGVTVGLTVLLTLIYLWIAGRSGYIGRQELNRPSVEQ